MNSPTILDPARMISDASVASNQTITNLSAPPISVSIRAGFYARVSSERQHDEKTIASQIQALQERLSLDGLTALQEHCFVDDGYSGSTLVRPALERLRDAVAAAELDRVYVHDPDRLTRNYAYQVVLLDEFRRAGVEVVFLNGSIGRTPEEKLLLQVQGMVAEYERAKIIERSRRGKRYAARQGRASAMSSAPYGYRYISRSEGQGEARYQIVLEQAQVIQQIFTWMGQERLSLGEVCRRLTRQGIPSPRGKAHWDRSTVWSLVRNPAYKGTAAYGKTSWGPMRPRLRVGRRQREQPRRPGSVYAMPCHEWITIPVPALVSAELFDAIAEQLAENRVLHRRRRADSDHHLLRGLLVCAECRHALTGRRTYRGSQRKTPRPAYYRCLGRDGCRYGGQRICSNPQVRADALEAEVWNDVRALLREPQRVEQEYQRRLRSEPPRDPWQVGPPAATMAHRVQRGVDLLIDAYRDGLLERVEFEPRLKQARERLEKLRAEAEAQAEHDAQQQNLRLVIGRLQEFAEKMDAGLDHADWLTRRGIIRTLVKRVEVGPDDVHIVYRVNPGAAEDDKTGMSHCWKRVRAFA